MKLIADHVLAGEPVAYFGVDDEVRDSELLNLLSGAREAEVVRADASAAEFWAPSHMDDPWEFTPGDLPSIVPPWQVMWLEFALPDGTNLNASRAAVLVECFPASSSDEPFADMPSASAMAKWTLRISVIWKTPVGLCLFPLYFVGRASDDGSFLRDDALGSQGYGIKTSAASFDKDNADPHGHSVKLVAVFMNLVHCALFAISMMHCKNAVMSQARIPRAFNQAHKRKHDRELLKHYVLDIEPAVQTLRRDAPQATGIKQAMHSCRGHFKDYRKGAGLFGRLKGLYWYGAHVRGDDKIGQIDKDYQIAPSKVTVH